MSSLICPYCGYNLGHADDAHDPHDTYEMDCPECENNFIFTLDYSVQYHEKKAPCLNGGHHKWENVVGHPKVLFEGVKRCAYCGEQNKPLNYDAAYNEAQEQLKDKEEK